MSELLKEIAAIVAGTGILGVVALGLLYVIKGAIATAVTQAGAREMARLRGEIEKELEREKQQGNVTLELFKSQLTFNAEVRRQAATHKVEAVMRLYASAKSAVETIYSANDEKRTRGQEAFNGFGDALRSALVLLEPEVVAELEAFAKELSSARIALSRTDRAAPNFADVISRGEAERAKLLETLRRELQITTVGLEVQS